MARWAGSGARGSGVAYVRGGGRGGGRWNIPIEIQLLPRVEGPPPLLDWVQKRPYAPRPKGDNPAPSPRRVPPPDGSHGAITPPSASEGDSKNPRAPRPSQNDPSGATRQWPFFGGEAAAQIKLPVKSLTNLAFCGTSRPRAGGQAGGEEVSRRASGARSEAEAEAAASASRPRAFSPPLSTQSVLFPCSYIPRHLPSFALPFLPHFFFHFSIPSPIPSSISQLLRPSVASERKDLLFR